MKFHPTEFYISKIGPFRGYRGGTNLWLDIDEYMRALVILPELEIKASLEEEGLVCIGSRKELDATVILPRADKGERLRGG